MIGLLFNRFTLYAAIAALVVAGAYAYRGSLIQQGYDVAMAEVAEAENTNLRELLRENSRLVGVVQRLNDVATKQQKSIEAFRARQRANDQRLRDQEADYQRRLAAASAEAVRKHAKATDDNLGRCRADVERLGLEAVQCSVAAHAVNDFLKEIP